MSDYNFDKKYIWYQYILNDIIQRVNIFKAEIYNIVNTTLFLSSLRRSTQSGDQEEEKLFYEIAQFSEECGMFINDNVAEKLRIINDELKLKDIKNIYKTQEEKIEIVFKTIQTLLSYNKEKYSKEIYNKEVVTEFDDIVECFDSFTSLANKKKEDIDVAESIAFMTLFDLCAIFNRDLELVTEKWLAICQKAQSQRMETLPIYPTMPSRYFRREVKKNFIAVNDIIEEYRERAAKYVKDLCFDNDADINFDNKVKILSIYDHTDITSMYRFRHMYSDKRDKTISFVPIQCPAWLLDIPRYIPILSHEVTHGFLEYVFNDVTLTKCSKDFIKFVNDTYSRIKNILPVIYIENNIFENPEEVITLEVLADFFSILISGPMYINTLLISLITREPISPKMSYFEIPPIYTRLKITLEMSKLLYERKDFSFIDAILDDYREYYYKGGHQYLIYNKNIKHHEEYKYYRNKITYFEKLFEAVYIPLNEFIEKHRSSLSRLFTEVTLTSDNIKELKNACGQNLGLKELRTLWMPTDDIFKSKSSIPSIIWSLIENNVEKEHIPESRLLRSLSKPLGQNVKYGECYEILFYDLLWTKKDTDVLKQISTVDESTLISELQSLLVSKVDKINKTNSNAGINIKPLVYPLFGEYDFMVIRPRFYGRQFIEKWPPHFGELSGKNNEPGRTHVKRYTYREIVLNNDQEIGETLEDSWKTDGCFGISQIECKPTTGFKELYKALEEFKKNSAGIQPLSIMQSSGWDDFLIFWRLPDGLSSLEILLKEFLLSQKRENPSFPILRSISHLMFNPEYNQEKIRGRIEPLNLSAVSEVILSRSNPEIGIDDNKFDRMINISTLRETLTLNISQTIGTHDADIKWLFYIDKPFRTISETLSRIIYYGFAEKSVTHFIIKK